MLNGRRLSRSGKLLSQRNIAAGRDGLNETSDHQYGPADGFGGHHDSAWRRGGVCRDRLHVQLGHSAILTAGAFDCTHVR